MNVLSYQLVFTHFKDFPSQINTSEIRWLFILLNNNKYQTLSKQDVTFHIKYQVREIACSFLS